ncbi:hypothetical protein CYL16_20965 [Mycobacterium sp. EPG1]|nr:hypothetical protein CYL16_20965 [Mycobacterium sp. EPG1]
MQFERGQHGVVRGALDPARPACGGERDRAVVQDRAAAEDHVAAVVVGIAEAAGPVGEQPYSAAVDVPAPRLGVTGRRRPRRDVEHLLEHVDVGERRGHVVHLHPMPPLFSPSPF